MTAISDMPKILLTDKAGPSQRLRVDPGQTGFFAGRMFRTYLEFVMPVAGPAVCARFTAPIDFILWSQSLTITQGAVRYEVFAAAPTPIVPTGTWTAGPVIGVNRMSERPQPFYTSQCTVESGGQFTGGNPLDLMQIRTASTNGQSSNVGNGTSERGLGAGVFYVRMSTLTGGLTVNDAAQGVISLLWEERVP